MLSGIANILSLGMCFLCGVFVPMNIMDRNVLKVSQFLPVYWYENVNETLGSYSHLTGEAAVSVWKGHWTGSYVCGSFCLHDPGSDQVSAAEITENNSRWLLIMVGYS